MKRNENGFTVIETLLIIIIVSLLLILGAYFVVRVSSQDAIVRDGITTENLEKTRRKLAAFVTQYKSIPKDLAVEEAVSYSRIDNQTAELCASFDSPRSGETDSVLGLIDAYDKFLGSSLHTHEAYRDNVDFHTHGSGRNCYQIAYAPINTAYEDQFMHDKKNWQYCDALRQYHGRFTGQTIKGFHIGDSFTTDPGTAGGRAILAADVDAYDENCVKIPVSDLQVGDKVEFGIEEGPVHGDETIYYVKAIKKTP